MIKGRGWRGSRLGTCGLAVLLAGCGLLDNPSPVAESSVVGAWNASCHGIAAASPHLTLGQNKSFRISDLPQKESLIDGSGTWELSGSSDQRIYLYFEDAADLGGDELFVERDGEKITLIYYVGDPDDGNGCRFGR